MVVLYILIGLILVVAFAFFLPISVSLKYNKKLAYKVKIAGIKVYPNKSKKTKEQENTANTPKKQNSFFDSLKQKRGFVGAIKEIAVFVKDCVTPIKLFLRFVHFKNVRLYVGIVGEDAAKTAVDYGAACSAVYPALSFIEGIANVSYKSVDVKADFEGKESEITFSLKIKSSVIFILIFLVRIFNEYKKFSVRNGLQ